MSDRLYNLARKYFTADAVETGTKLLRPFYELNPVNLDAYAQEFAANGHELPHYTLRATRRGGYYPERKDYIFYFDASYTFVLHAEGLHLAVIGVEFDPSGAVEVVQNQGRKTSKIKDKKERRHVYSLLHRVKNFKDMDLSYVIDWVRKCGSPRITMPAASQSDYYIEKPRNGEESKLKKRLIKTYDEAAQRFGFQLSDDGSHYYLDL